MKFCKMLLSKITKAYDDRLFEDIIGYDHIKNLFRMSLSSDSAIHILLEGPPASAKAMFLTSLMHQLKSCYFADGTNSTKAGMIEYLFKNRPRYLLVDEIDKTAPSSGMCRREICSGNNMASELPARAEELVLSLVLLLATSACSHD